MGALKEIWRNPHLDIYNKYLLFQAIPMNLLLWGAETWSLHKSQLDQLKVFLHIFDWFITKYGKTTTKDREENRQQMAADWHPSNDFEPLVTRLFIGASYESAARPPMDNRDVIDIGLCVISRCRMYSEEYKNWIARENESPPITEMINSFKEYWANVIPLANQTAAPASQHGYGMAAIDDDALIASNREPLANFGATYATTQESMKSQATTMAAMQG